MFSGIAGRKMVRGRTLLFVGGSERRPFQPRVYIRYRPFIIISIEALLIGARKKGANFLGAFDLNRRMAQKPTARQRNYTFINNILTFVLAASHELPDSRWGRRADRQGVRALFVPLVHIGRLNCSWPRRPAAESARFYIFKVVLAAFLRAKRARRSAMSRQRSERRRTNGALVRGAIFSHFC